MASLLFNVGDKDAGKRTKRIANDIGHEWVSTFLPADGKAFRLVMFEALNVKRELNLAVISRYQVHDRCSDPIPLGFSR